MGDHQGRVKAQGWIVKSRAFDAETPCDGQGGQRAGPSQRNCGNNRRPAIPGSLGIGRGVSPAPIELLNSVLAASTANGSILVDGHRAPSAPGSACRPSADALTSSTLRSRLPAPSAASAKAARRKGIPWWQSSRLREWIAGDSHRGSCPRHPTVANPTRTESKAGTVRRTRQGHLDANYGRRQARTVRGVTSSYSFRKLLAATPSKPSA